ncbi:MAG: hypothetical protein QXJ11_06405 [Candidatus Bathyarchaeia archaeon]
MKRQKLLTLFAFFLFSILIGVARAEDDFIFTQFLETPLIILTILIIIDIIAFVYHRIRK